MKALAIVVAAGAFGALAGVVGSLVWRARPRPPICDGCCVVGSDGSVIPCRACPEHGELVDEVGIEIPHARRPPLDENAHAVI